MTRLADVARPAGPALFTPIVRSRVMHRIDAAAAGRITLIVAPAGYGKSLALSHWLQRQAHAHVRFDVQTDHATLLGFARGIAEAFPQFPALRKTVATAFQNSASASAPGDEMARWMAAHLESFNGIIAIDDFHRAGEDLEVSRFVSALIARTKREVHWVISTRSTLDLPVASWLGYGEAHFIIGDRDLTFLDDEALELSGGAGGTLSPQALRGVMDATSGWPVALGFALRSSTTLSSAAGLSHSRREVLFQYLAEQVYADLSKEERDLLHFAAYLPSIEVSVLEVAGYHAAARVLEAVRRRVTFLSLEAPGKYKCHDLFSEFLRRQIERTDPADARYLQEGAADSLERGGDVVGALRIYARLRAVDSLVRLLRAHGFDLMDHSHGDVVESALQALPAEVRAADAIILGLRAQRAADSGHFERAEALFNSALANELEPNIKLKLSIALALLLVNQGRPIDRLLSPLEFYEGRLDLRAEAAALLATSSVATHEKDNSDTRIEDAERLCSFVESPEVRAKVLLRIGIAKLTLGYNGDDVISGLTAAAELAGSLGMFGVAARAYNVLGMAQLFYLNAPAETLRSENLGSLAACKSADRFALQTALAYSITAHTNLGNEQALEPLLARLGEAATSDSKRTRAIASYTRATVCAWNEQFRDAALLMADLHASSYGYYDFDRLFNMACHALYAAAAEEISLGKDLMSVVMQKLIDCRSPHPYGVAKQGVAVVFAALAECLLGRRQRAIKILKLVPPGLPAFVLLLRDVVDELCVGRKTNERLFGAMRLPTDTAYAGVARTLEACIKHFIRKKAESNRAAPALTGAERDILFDLDRGRSPKEIAAESGRSIHTVRTLIQRAIQKLGCNGRQEALAVARDSDLLQKKT